MKTSYFKRLLCWGVLIAMFSCTVLTGCGSKEVESGDSQGVKDKTTIKVQWIGDFKMEDSTDKISGKTIKGLKVLEDEFEKQNKNINVEFVIMSWDDYTQKTQAMLMSNDCDVYQVPAIANIAPQGLLEPLSPYIEKDNFDTSIYIDGQIDGWKAVGSEDTESKIYGLPFIGDTRFIYYNKKIFDDWKVPYLPKEVTPEQVFELAKKMTGKNPVTGKDNYGVFSKGGDAADTVMNISESFGGTWGSGIKFDELKFNFDSPTMVKALTYLKDIAKYAPEGTMAGQGGELMYTAEDNIAMNLRASPVHANTVVGVGLDENYGASYLFVNPTEGKGGMFAESPYCIGKNSKHKDEAWEYLKFSSSEFFQKYMWENQREQFTPVIKAAMDWDSIKAEPTAQVMLESMPKLWTPRYIYRAAQPRYILSEAVESAMMGQQSPEGALKAAQKNAEEWVEQQKK